MAKLAITIRMILAPFRLAIALKAILLRVQKLRNFDMTNRMVLCRQFHRQGSSALAYPAQRRFRITQRIRLNQPLQCIQQLRVPLDRLFRPAPDRRTDPARNLFPIRTPFAIAFLDNPYTRLTRTTPPYPINRASFAAMIRRIRSSSSDHTSLSLFLPLVVSCQYLYNTPS